MVRRRATLWRCPKCGHRFVTRNLWHACGRYRLEDHFAGKAPVLRATFRRWRIVIQARVRFAGAVIRRDWVDAALWLRRRVKHPRVFRTEDFGRLGYGIHFRLTKPSEIDRDLRALVREAYAAAVVRPRSRAPAGRD